MSQEMSFKTEMLWVLALLPVMYVIMRYFGIMAGVALCGLTCSFCAYMDYDWFMLHRKARFAVVLFGRRGARVFYFLFGLVIVLGAIWVANQPNK